MMLLRHDYAEVTRRGAVPLRVQSVQPSLFERVGQVLIALPWKVIGVVGFAAVLLAGTAIGVRELVLGVDRPVSEVVVKGRFSAMESADVQARVKGLIGTSFLYSDLDQVKRDLEQEPWVDAVAVRRVWPSGLEIYALEQQPVAYWNGASFLNTRIEVFSPEKAPAYPGLPRLFGPQGQEASVYAFWRQAQLALARLGSGVSAVVLQPRGAWEFQLADGARVQLGREDQAGRFERFLGVFADIDIPADVEYYDARYANGVAVKWKPVEDMVTTAAKDQARH